MKIRNIQCSMCEGEGSVPIASFSLQSVSCPQCCGERMLAIMVPEAGDVYGKPEHQCRFENQENVRCCKPLGHNDAHDFYYRSSGERP